MRNQFDQHDPVVLRFCQYLAEKVFYHMFCVLYLTPPNSQAVRAHSDDQDVFVFQIWGKKLWAIYDKSVGPTDCLSEELEAKKFSKETSSQQPTVQKPGPAGKSPFPHLCYTEEMVGKSAGIDPDLLAKHCKPTSILMSPGDILYMPRGCVHQACTFSDCDGGGQPGTNISVRKSSKDCTSQSQSSAQPSLHLTFTIPSCDFTYGIMLQRYLEKVLSVPNTLKEFAKFDKFELDNLNSATAVAALGAFETQLAECIVDGFDLGSLGGLLETKLLPINTRQKILGQELTSSIGNSVEKPFSEKFVRLAPGIAFILMLFINTPNSLCIQ